MVVWFDFVGEDSGEDVIMTWLSVSEESEVRVRVGVRGGWRRKRESRNR